MTDQRWNGNKSTADLRDALSCLDTQLKFFYIYLKSLADWLAG